MSPFSNPMDNRPPLSDWIHSAYKVLLDAIDDTDKEITREDAIHLLATTDDFPAGSTDAEYALDRLLERGYLYAVDDDLRVTVPTDLEAEPGDLDEKSPNTPFE